MADRGHDWRRGTWIWVLTALLLGGCLKPDPTLVQAQLRAGQDINPSAAGRAAPVVVRVYALKGTGVFESADFFALYDRDQATLKDEMLGRDEFQLVPGGSQTMNKEVPGEARFLGVLVAYRELERANWRAVYPLRPQKANPVTITVGQRAVTIGP